MMKCVQEASDKKAPKGTYFEANQGEEQNENEGKFMSRSVKALNPKGFHSNLWQ